MENMIKEATQMVTYIQQGKKDLYKVAFEANGTNYIRTKVREEAISEQILDVITVTMDHKNIQTYENSDMFYYMQDIESDAIAMPISFRADWKARFIDGKRYKIDIGEISTETLKKPKRELMTTPNLIKMTKENGADSIRRQQDIALFKALKASTANGGSQVVNATWSTDVTKNVFVDMLNVFAVAKLKPVKWVISQKVWNSLLKMDASEIGDLSGEMLQNGLKQKMLLDLPVVVAINGDIHDGNDYFLDDATAAHSSCYLVADKDYLGKIIKVGTDEIFSEWKKNIFEWSSSRTVGMGLGNTAGIARGYITF